MKASILNASKLKDALLHRTAKHDMAGMASNVRPFLFHIKDAKKVERF